MFYFRIEGPFLLTFLANQESLPVSQIIHKQEAYLPQADLVFSFTL